MTLMQGGAGNTVSIWLCFTSTLVSMCCALALAVCCAWLRRKHSREIFIFLLMHIGLADVLLAVWQTCLHITRIQGLPLLDCRTFIFVQRSLVMLTTLDALALAVGMVLQLHSRNKHIPRILWVAPWLAVPLSIVMELGYLITEEVTEDHDFAELCYSNGLGSHLYIFEVSTIFVITVILHVVVIGQAWRTAPRSVARRSVWSASRYVLAFFLTHVLHVGYKIWLWVDEAALGSCSFEVLRVIGNICLNLNGFFNFLAFWIHARRIARSQTATVNGHVNFHTEGSLTETLEIPHGEEARRSHKINRDKFRKDWLKDEFGHCLSDLYESCMCAPSTDSILSTEMDAEHATHGIANGTSSDGFIDD